MFCVMTNETVENPQPSNKSIIIKSKNKKTKKRYLFGSLRNTFAPQLQISMIKYPYLIPVINI